MPGDGPVRNTGPAAGYRRSGSIVTTSSHAGTQHYPWWSIMRREFGMVA